MAKVLKKTEEKKSIQISSQRRFTRVTPDKVRIAGALITGKKIRDALAILQFLKMAAAKPIILTLKAALAIAKEKDYAEDSLYVLRIFADEGPKLKRRRIIHQGKATAILKRMSHITVILEIKNNALRQKLEIKKSDIKQPKGVTHGS